MFNWKLAADYGPDHPIHTLAIKVDKEMARQINEFVMDNVFVDNENDSCEKFYIWNHLHNDT